MTGRAQMAQSIAACLAQVIEAADRARMRDELGQALAAALDTVGEGMPRYDLFGDLRADALFWADCASPAELEAYVGAGLRAIERKTFAPRAKKRLFVDLWQALSDEDRRRFLARVDPDGRFRSMTKESRHEGN